MVKLTLKWPNGHKGGIGTVPTSKSGVGSGSGVRV